MNARSPHERDSFGGATPEINVEGDELKPTTALKTKLTLPPLRSTWISRSRLINRMDESFERKLTLLSAPAGFGKTTLLVNWVHERKIPSAWFSVDKADNAPSQFLNYIILGLQSLKAGVGKAALTMLRSPQPPPIESTLINLINDAITIPEEFALILDDYHLIDAKPIHDMIVFMLENLPERMHLIIATRSDPPLPILARLRSQDHLIELRSADLSFTADETADLFNKRLKLRLSPQDIDVLGTRTEGWIAGLQLAALSLHGRKDPSSFLKSFKGDNRYIADYFMEEVLDRQPEYLQDFLLQTSLLKRFSAPLCNEITARQDSQQILNALERTNLFIVPLDHERNWYRYHHLFADLLKQRLMSSHKALVNVIHTHAAAWFEKNGFLTEAIDHAFDAGIYDTASRLIDNLAEIDWNRDKENRFIRWIKKLPGSYINTNPRLCIIYARELFKNGFRDEAEKKLQTAEKIIQSPTTHSDQALLLTGRIAVIRAYIAAHKGLTDDSINNAKLALKHLPPQDAMWRSVAATTLGLGYGFNGKGDIPQAYQAFQKTVDISKKAGNLYYQIFAQAYLAGALSAMCRLHEAEALCHTSLHQAEEYGFHQTSLAGSLYGTMGRIHAEWGNLDKGIGYIKEAIRLSELGRDPIMLAFSRLHLLRAYIYKMDIAGILGVMENLNNSVKTTTLSVWIENWISAFNAMIWTASGNIQAAVQWAKDRELSIETPLSYLRELELYALANILYEQQRTEEADLLLTRLIQGAESGGRWFFIVDMRLLRVLIFLKRSQNEASLDELIKTIKVAEPAGMIQVFLSRGKPILDLLNQLLELNKKPIQQTITESQLLFVKKIITKNKIQSDAKNANLSEPLSEREIEVLQLIAEGLKNQEIADKLFISLNTVKTHTKNINAKLNVSSRIKAVAHAKELGLL